MLLKKENVDIENWRFTVLIKKVKHGKTVQRAIKDIARPFLLERGQSPMLTDDSVIVKKNLAQYDHAKPNYRKQIFQKL